MMNIYSTKIKLPDVAMQPSHLSSDFALGSWNFISSLLILLLYSAICRGF